jgi:plastocyanin
MEALARQSDPFCAKTPKNNEDVVVNGGGVRDVLVRLPVGAAKGAAPATAATIDQKECMYTPRVTGIVSGQKVAVTNSDGTTHNVHSYVGDETKFNEAQPKGSAAVEKDVEAEAGEVMKLKCDVHAWMESYVVVTDHPYFAVTSDDGSFRIEKVPAGTYKLEAWHPKLGVKTVEVKVEDGATAEAKFPAFAAADYKK